VVVGRLLGGAPVLLGAVLAMSCMGIIHVITETIDVQTTPSGARIGVRPGAGDYESPARITLRRKGEGTVNVSDPASMGAA
jgi:hypothetical protein